MRASLPQMRREEARTFSLSTNVERDKRKELKSNIAKEGQRRQE